MTIFFQIGLVILLILLNGYFVASEFALVAVRKTRIEELAKKGNVTAKILRRSLLDLDNYISATQLGITLASLALGWIGEPALAHLFEPFFHFLPQEAAIFTSHTTAVITAFAIITFLHIVIGELAPKSIALQYPERTSLFIITPLVIFSRIFKPFIWLLNNTGQLVLRLIGIRPAKEGSSIHSEDELKMLLRQSSLGGVIPEKEVEIVMNAFQLGDIPVKIVMIPRMEVVAFNITTPLREVVQKLVDNPHSRFPVYEGSVDNVIGFVHVKDIYRKLLVIGDKLPLSKLDIMRKIISVPESKKIGSVLQDMRKKRIHLAIVHDEFGGTAGIVTLEDIIESLVGEIEDEFDPLTLEIERLKDGDYRILGHTLIETIQKKFKLPIKGQGYSTIGGLVFGLLGRAPKQGDTVEIGRLLFEVVDIEGKRVKELKLHKTRKRNK